MLHMLPFYRPSKSTSTCAMHSVATFVANTLLNYRILFHSIHLHYYDLINEKRYYAFERNCLQGQSIENRRSLPERSIFIQKFREGYRALLSNIGLPKVIRQTWEQFVNGTVVTYFECEGMWSSIRVRHSSYMSMHPTLNIQSIKFIGQKPL